MEVRIPGADMNPYFALSAILLLGLRGIRKQLPLPGPPITHFKPEDRSNGKVGAVLMRSLWYSDAAFVFCRLRCCRRRLRRLLNG